MKLLSTFWIGMAVLGNQAYAGSDIFTKLDCTFSQIFATKQDLPPRSVSLIVMSDNETKWLEEGTEYDAAFIPSGISHGGQYSFIAYRNLISTDTLILPGSCMSRNCHSEKFAVKNGAVASMTSQTIGYGEFIISVYTGTCIFAEALE